MSRTITYSTGRVKRVPDNKKVALENSYNQLYDSIVDFLPRLEFKDIRICFLLFYIMRICSRHDKKNISVTAGLFAHFNEYLVEYGWQEISRSTFNRFIANLEKHGFLVQQTVTRAGVTKALRGEYYMNAFLIWKGTSKAREDFIKQELAEFIGRTGGYVYGLNNK